MTARAIYPVTPSELEYAAFTHGVDITIDTANERAFVTVGQVTLYTELAHEVTC